MIGMNCMKLAPQLVAQEAVDLAAAVSLAACTVVRTFHSTPASRRWPRPRITWSKVAAAALCDADRCRASRADRRSRSRRGTRSRSKNAAHSASSSVPLVWIVCSAR